MPDFQAHLDKARANTEVYEELRTKGLPVDWQATVLFYAAVHYVEALAALDQVHSENHPQRDEYIKNNHKVEFWTLYDALKQESVKARYLSNAPRLSGSHWRKCAFSLSDDQIKRRLCDTHLKAIREYTEARIPRPAPTIPAASVATPRAAD